MYEREALNHDLSLKSLVETVNYKKEFVRENPSYFRPDGLTVFTGPQGSGKTLSAVRYVCKLMKTYKNCKLVSNVMINDFPIITFEEWKKKYYSKSIYLNYNDLSDKFRKQILTDYLAINRVFPFYNCDDLKTYNNYDEGVIFFIDEIQLYLNSLESKNISMEVMTEISQQRKQRKHIVATSQVFGRLAKPLREQFSTIINCRCFLDCLQYNRAFLQEDLESNDDNMTFKGKCNKIQLFFHNPHDYKNYDTYFKVQSLETENFNRGDIYDRTSIVSNTDNN